jgi:hypothetical protein
LNGALSPCGWFAKAAVRAGASLEEAKAGVESATANLANAKANGARHDDETIFDRFDYIFRLRNSRLTGHGMPAPLRRMRSMS